MRPRWDDDERGRGVGDASAFSESVDELVGALREPDWVAEDPEAHLLPHLRRACERLPFELGETSADPNVFEVRLAWSGDGGVGAIRAAVFALIGSVAESATFVRQRREGNELSFEVVTGMLGSDAHFAPHGHALILRVTSSRSGEHK